jgi:hypothetical protein
LALGCKSAGTFETCRGGKRYYPPLQWSMLRWTPQFWSGISLGDKGGLSDGWYSEGCFYAPAIAETAGMSCTGMPLRIDCPTTTSTSPSSVQSFTDTPARAAATFCQR